jgi:hypothetical protein
MPSNPCHAADRLGTELAVSASFSVANAAVMIIVVVLFLGPDNIHCRLW